MINFIILGAGKGTRMNSDIPKVLHKVCDKTILQICVDLCNNLKNESNKIVAVVSQDMMQNFNDLLPKNVDFVIFLCGDKLIGDDIADEKIPLFRSSII